MNGDRGAYALYLILLAMLVGSGLLARRIPLSQAAKMAGAWLLIFLIAFVIFTFRHDFRSAGDRLMAEVNGNAVQQGDILRIGRSEDGHYWVNGTVNGRTVRFLIDSGATVTSLSADAAAGAGVRPDSNFRVAVDTANGLVMADRAHVGRLTIGTIERRDFAVHVSEAFGDTNVLGMNFLSSLSAWGVEDGWLVLKL